MSRILVIDSSDEMRHEIDKIQHSSEWKYSSNQHKVCNNEEYINDYDRSISTYSSKCSDGLKSEYDFVFAANLSAASNTLRQSVIDLIVCDTHVLVGDLPSKPSDSCVDVFLWCSEIRKNQLRMNIPVIFVSNENSLSNKLKAFQNGADDYLVRPFEILELLIRIEAHLNRMRKLEQSETQIQQGNIILKIPFQKAVLCEGDVERDLKLTPTEFQLLYYFVKNPDEVLSRDQLLSTIWSDNIQILARTIDKHISTLKKKLASQGHSIQSVHSQGYRFSNANT